MAQLTVSEANSDAEKRVHELLDLYGSADACAAVLLCDAHDPTRLAYRIFAEDLSATDLTYGELRSRSEQFASALSDLGVRAGDRVATLMGKSRDYLIALMGIWRLGAVHVPLFTAFAAPAIIFRLKHSKAKIVLCDEAQRSKLESEQARTALGSCLVAAKGAVRGGTFSLDDLLSGSAYGFPAAVLGGNAPIIHIFTSGTTGDPKGVVVPLRALAAFHTYAEFGQGVRSDEDVFWCAADPGWAYGLYFGVLTTFTTGVRSILFEGGFSPEGTMAIMTQERVTNFAAAPTVYRALRSSALAPSTQLYLSRASSAGEPLTPEVNIWAQEALGVMVHDHYGQTEAGMLINNHHDPRVARPIKVGSMGQAMPGWKAEILKEAEDVEAAVGEAGRVAMVVDASPLMWFSGYDGGASKASGKFAGDGRWYITGDTGHVDDEGYFFFSARDDDVIIMAGYRIGPFEVESVMATHPAVAECAVIAVPDEVRGEVIEAYVVARDGVQPDAALEKEIQQWVKQHYAAHAYPRRVHFTDGMPKTPSGKIQRFMLKRRRLEELEQQTTGPRGD
jgi:acetyl-CoA synthetase